MSTALPFRSRVRNVAHATAAPVALSLIATRPDGADACRVLLRGEVDGEFARCRAHALLVLDTLHARHGCPVDVQLLDAAGVPVFVCSAGGVS